MKMEAESQNGPRHARRKRRRAFLSHQKEHAKKGRFGQGGQLPEDTYKYFIRIMEVSQKSRNNKEDMEVLANNALEEVKEKEVETCCNQMASRVVEELLQFAPDEKLIRLSNSFGAEYRLVFTDPFCSHVLQKLILTLAYRILNKEENPRSAETDEQFIACFTRSAKYALNNLEDFIFDTYANHVLRTIFACVNGYPIKMEVKKKDTIPETRFTTPDAFDELAKAFVHNIKTWPQFNDLSTQVHTSGCLQALMYSVRENPKLSKTLVKKVLEACNGISDLTDPKYASLLHLMETAVTAAPPKQFLKFHQMLKGKLAELAVQRATNFVVQKLILHCVVKEDFEEMFEELADIIPKVIEIQLTGVILALAKTCGRLKAKQGEFINIVLNGLNCSDQTNAAPVIACLVKYDSFKPDMYKTTVNGSVVLQEMLNFTKPMRLVTSLLSMTDERLAVFLSDCHGCHVTDAFIQSPFVGEKSREKLFKKLKKRYAALAVSKHGSRSFDAIWNCLHQNQRLVIIEELKLEQSFVVSTVFGRIIASKYRLDLFRQDKNTWMRQCSDKTKRETTS